MSAHIDALDDIAHFAWVNSRRQFAEKTSVVAGRGKSQTL